MPPLENADWASQSIWNSVKSDDYNYSSGTQRCLEWSKDVSLLLHGGDGAARPSLKQHGSPTWWPHIPRATHTPHNRKSYLSAWGIRRPFRSAAWYSHSDRTGSSPTVARTAWRPASRAVAPEAWAEEPRLPLREDPWSRLAVSTSGPSAAAARPRCRGRAGRTRRTEGQKRRRLEVGIFLFIKDFKCHS